MRDRTPRQGLGLGLLWRPELARTTCDRVAGGNVGFVEVIAESVGGALPPDLVAAAEAGATVVPHGVALGVGGAARPDPRRLARLAGLAKRCGAPLVSEHLAFVRAGGVEAGHLLPVPRTRVSLDVVVENVRDAAGALPVPLALEPIATLVEWPGAELTELAFLTELLDRTDVDLVLDVANLHVNAANRRRAGGDGPDTDPMALVEGLPLDRVAYVHAAGGRVVGGRHHDTHRDPLWPEVETLVEELWARHEIPGLLLERDGDFPDHAEIDGELARLAAAAERGRARRRAARPGSRSPSPRVTSVTAPPRPAGTAAAPSAPAAPTASAVPSAPASALAAPSTPSAPDRRPSSAAPYTPPAPDRRPLSAAPSAPSAPDRRHLAVAQAGFLRAVAAGGPPPPGFDPDDLAAVAAVLAGKRAAAVAHAAPDIAALPAFRERFVPWARAHPHRDGRTGADDAVAFLRSLPPADRTVHACLAAVRIELARPTWRPRLRLWPNQEAAVIGAGVGRWRRAGVRR